MVTKTAGVVPAAFGAGENVTVWVDHVRDKSSGSATLSYLYCKNKGISEHKKHDFW